MPSLPSPIPTAKPWMKVLREQNTRTTIQMQWRFLADIALVEKRLKEIHPCGVGAEAPSRGVSHSKQPAAQQDTCLMCISKI